MPSVHGGADSEEQRACFERLRERLASNLRRLRDDVGLSQEKLAAAAGIANRYVVQLERGEAGNPSLRLIAALSHALSVDATDLLKEAPPPTLRSRGRPRKPKSTTSS